MQRRSGGFRAVLFGITAALTLSFCLTACGTGETTVEPTLDPNNPVTIDIWHYYNGPQKKALDAMVAEFNDTVGLEQGIIVEAFSQGKIAKLTEKVIDAANKKVGADEIPSIFAAYPDTAYQVDQLGLVADLSPYFTEEELAEYVPGYIDEGRISGADSLKIFPMAKSTEIMMLNKTDWDKFAAETGASLDSLKTVEGLVKVAQQYYEWTDAQTETPDDGKAFFGRDAVANYFVIGCKQLGTEIFDMSSGSIVFHTDREIIRKLWDNYYTPSVNGWFGAYQQFRADDAKTGKIIALIGSTSGATYFPTEVSVDDAEGYPIESYAMEIPVFEGGEKVNVQQGAGLVVAKSDPKTEYASSIFLKWFTEEDRNIQFSISSGYLPVKISANDMEKINAAVEQNSESAAVVKKLSAFLPVSIQTVKDFELYTSKAFNGGTEARNVLEYSLSNLVKKDLAEIQSLVDNGMTRSEAAAQYTTDEHFNEWYESFCQALEAAVS